MPASVPREVAGHSDRDFALGCDLDHYPITIAVVGRANEFRVAIFLDVTRVQISLPRICTVKCATRVANEPRLAVRKSRPLRSAVNSRVLPSSMIGALRSSPMAPINSPSEAFGSGAVGSVERKPSGRNSRTAHGDHPGGTRPAPVRPGCKIIPLSVQLESSVYLHAARFLTRFVDRAAFNLDAIDLFGTKILNVAFIGAVSGNI